jgi:hypothetical protein
MGLIVLRCPVTCRDYTIGIEIDRRSFDRLPEMRFKAHCPHCDGRHDWTPRQARLVEDKPPLRRAVTAKCE